ADIVFHQPSASSSETPRSPSPSLPAEDENGTPAGPSSVHATETVSSSSSYKGKGKKRALQAYAGVTKRSYSKASSPIGDSAGKDRFEKDDINRIMDWLDESLNYGAIYGFPGATPPPGTPVMNSNTAYGKLADVVNRASKGRFRLNAKSMRERWGRHRSKYITTKKIVESTGFGINDADRANNIFSISAKKEKLCLGYQRMDALFGTKPNITPLMHGSYNDEDDQDGQTALDRIRESEATQSLLQLRRQDTITSYRDVDGNIIVNDPAGPSNSSATPRRQHVPRTSTIAVVKSTSSFPGEGVAARKPLISLNVGSSNPKGNMIAAFERMAQSKAEATTKIADDRLAWEKTRWEREQEERREVARKETEQEERKLKVVGRDNRVNKKVDLLKTAIEKGIVSGEDALKMMRKIMGEYDENEEDNS
ncbi:hypothetical protein BGX24_005879, partial [Mortierella sp. AD032]